MIGDRRSLFDVRDGKSVKFGPRKTEAEPIMAHFVYNPPTALRMRRPIDTPVLDANLSLLPFSGAACDE